MSLISMKYDDVPHLVAWALNIFFYTIKIFLPIKNIFVIEQVCNLPPSFQAYNKLNTKYGRLFGLFMVF